MGPRIGGIAAGVSGDGTIVVGSAILNYEVRPRKTEGVGEAAILVTSAPAFSRFAPIAEAPVAEAPTFPKDGAPSPVAEPAPEGTASGGLALEGVATEQGRLIGLGLGWGSQATAISRDGRVVVGTLPLPGTAFRWTEADGVRAIGDLTGGSVRTVPFALSEDGGAIVGSARSREGEEAFRWTADGGMVPLGDLPGAAFRSIARGISADGSLVVGTGSGERSGESPGGDRAFVWDAERGMRDLHRLLVAQARPGALPARFARWRLREASAVRLTVDGRPQIAGSAVDEAGRRVAFVATLAAR